jgi:acetyltransferase-like isoleucine patch superfamily enzyme
LNLAFNIRTRFICLLTHDEAGFSLLVQGDFAIFTGSIVSINRNAKVVLGSGYIGSNLRLCCFEAIDIGYDVAISEHVTIRDSDNHKLNSNPKISSPIKIGNHVGLG